MSIRGFKIGNGAVQKYDYNSLDNKPGVDDTLTVSGAAADAKKTGDEIADLKSALTYRFNAIHSISADFYIYGKSDSTSKGFLRKSNSFVATDYIPVYEGMKLCITGTGFENGSVAFAYDSNYDKIDNILWETGNGEYKRYTNEVITVASGVAFVRCSFCIDNDRTYFVTTDKDGADYIDAFRKIPDNAVKIHMDMLAGASWTGGQSETTLMPYNISTAGASYRASAKELITLPFGKHTKILIRFKNSNYRVGLRFGDCVNHMDKVIYYYGDGAVIDVSKVATTTYTQHPNYIGASYGFPIFGKDPASNDNEAKRITSDDVTIAGLELYALNEDVDNMDDKILERAKLSGIVYGADSHRKTIYDNAVILHTSDPHGDEHRIRRFLKFASKVGVDLSAITGDFVSYNTYSGFGWFHDLVNAHTGEVAICTGNHDVYVPSQTDDEVYTAMFAPIATKLGISSGKTYYYKDIASKKLRIISVNLYQYDGQAEVFGDRAKTHFNTDQISWLISTLSSTPANYGVIILEHSPQRSIKNAMDSDYPTFFQLANNRSWDMTNSNVDGAPIYDLVDAFIGKTTINQTYTQVGTPSSITVTADFSSVASGVEFIAYMSGHLHMDSICYVPNATHKQLILNTICTLPLYGGQYYSYLMDGSYIGRDAVGLAQDAFNAYVIDRVNKTVKVIRIGADSTYDMREREYMEIPYV